MPLTRRRVREIALAAALGALGPAPAFAEDAVAQAKRLLAEAERLAGFDQARQQQLAAAVALFEQSAALADRAGDTEVGAQAWTRLGLGYWELKRYREAEAATRRGIAMARAAGLPATEAAGRRLLGNMFLRSVRVDEARAAFDESLTAARKSADAEAIVRTLGNLSNLEMHWGNAGQAIAHARDAVAELDRASGRGVAVAPRAMYFCLVNLGLALRDAGDYGEAGAYLERAFAVALHPEMALFRHRALKYSAEWYMAQGDVERAERFYERALEPSSLPVEFQNRELEAQTLCELAAPLAALRGRWVEAASLYARGIAIYEKEGMLSDVMLALPMLGRALAMSGDGTAARGVLDKAVARAGSSRWPRSLTAAHLERARLHALQGRAFPAEDDYRRALEVARSYRLRPDESAALAGLAQVALSRGALQEALARLEAAAGVVEAVRGHIAGAEQRATFAEAAHTTYSSLYETHLRLHAQEPDAGHEALAFLAVERERTHDLQRALDAAAAASRPGARLGLAPGRSRRVASLQAQLQAPALSESQRRALLHQLDDAERELAMAPDTGPREPGVIPPRDIERLRSVLDDDEALLAYAGAGEWLRVFVVTRGGLRSLAVTDPAGLEERAGLFASLLAEGRSQEALAVGRALARSVLTPALGAVPKGTRRLLLSATGGLAGLPFGALPIAADSPAPVAPLLARYEVAAIPSLSGLSALRAGARAPASRDLLALGDPLGEAGAVPPFAAELFRGARLGPLPASRQEAESLRGALSGHSDVLLGRSASEAALYGLPLHEYKVLHFATHAVLDPQVPARSAIVLAAGEGQDGLLQQREIFGLGLSADLVVLSACRSATGRAGRAEGVQSLGRAFLHAGARSVVGTLWDVEDRATRRLVERFYAELTQGAPVGAALRAAQRAGFGRDPWASARDWAGFVAIGEPLARPRLARAWTRAGWPWLALVGLASAAAVLARSLIGRWGRRVPRAAG